MTTNVEDRRSKLRSATMNPLCAFHLPLARYHTAGFLLGSSVNALRSGI
jgi:hypothetical protein